MNEMNYPDRLRAQLSTDGILPLIGVYDVFSASIAARFYNGLFISGFSFAASYYGLPDVGFISWSDITALAQRIRLLLPNHHIVVDIDDGYCDADVACHVVGLLEQMGMSGVVLEDQKRPRRCGHVGGKQILELDVFMEKLERVLRHRKHMYVVARTDAMEPDEVMRRVEAFSATEADAILVDGISDINIVREVAKISAKPLVFNQIYGGKSPPMSLTELKAIGISMVNYSTPCITAVQSAMFEVMQKLKQQDGLLTEDLAPGVALNECNKVLNDNLKRDLHLINKGCGEVLVEQKNARTS